MWGYIYRTREAYKYTGNFIFACKFAFLAGILPITGKVLGIKDKTDALGKKLAQQRSEEIEFTTPFGNFVTKTLNGWTVLTENYEPEVKKVMVNNYFKHQEEERTFINIGAHIGRWLVEFVSNYGYKGIAFEPSKETFSYLKRNVELSHIDDKIELYNFGLSNSAGNKEFIYIPEHDGHSHIISEHESSENTISIETKIFDELPLSVNRNTVKMIMIDVEGHEYEVLQGMQESLKKLKEVDIIVEVFDEDPNKEIVLALMESMGFACTRITHADYLFSK